MLILDILWSSPVRNNNSNGQVLVVAGQPVRVTHETVPIKKIRLDPQNPRVRFQIQHLGKKSVSDSALLDLIRDQPGYDGLQKAIRKAGGLHDPVIVRNDGTIVEGNSRATAIKTLHEGNPSDHRWKSIPVIRLPKDVPDSATSMLMAAYHVAGKTTWRPYAQADQIYHLAKTHGWSTEQIADETRMSKREVEQYLEAYAYLVEEVLPHAGKGAGRQLLEKKWSHALEFVKNRKLGELREDPKVRKHVAKLLVQDKIKGAEVRDLHKVLKHKKASTALSKEGFKAAKEVLKKSDPTVDSPALRQMQRLTETLRAMQQAEWAVFKTDSKARQILIDHATAVSELMAVVGVKNGSRRG
jgi:hypothetical protein